MLQLKASAFCQATATTQTHPLSLHDALPICTSAARATTTRVTSTRVRRVMVIPGPSCAVVRAEVLRGREAAAGPRVEVRREGPPREAGAAGRGRKSGVEGKSGGGGGGRWTGGE